eukprot:809078-Amphidinium_carterae.1
MDTADSQYIGAELHAILPAVRSTPIGRRGTSDCKGAVKAANGIKRGIVAVTQHHKFAWIRAR